MKYSYYTRQKMSAKRKAWWNKRKSTVEVAEHPVINGYIPLTVGKVTIMINSKINEAVKIG